MIQENRKNLNVGIIAGLILLAALSRLLPHPPNFTPIGGMALFGAAYFGRKYLAVLVPLVALWISNFLLDNLVYAEYYEGIVWISNIGVYIAILAVVAFGWLVLKKVRFSNLILASLGASLLFFIVSNVGVWLSGMIYPKTWAGLVECFTLAIPFFGNTLFGDLLFVGLLFGSYELIRHRALQPALND
ncbi:MAG: hypothetical protein KDC44_25310 [Phaeodactylibacter sp.]|nr:hypothetical protein [Phaeodactylibacter sp.]